MNNKYYKILVLLLLLFWALPVHAQTPCPTFTPENPSANFCLDKIAAGCGPCMGGEGDCDGDPGQGECAEGLLCLRDVGANYGLPSDYDVCGRTYSVTLGWNPNSETDLAGYKIYYGTASRNSGGYTIPNSHARITAGTETYTFPSLPDGTYYFSLTAYDTSDNESEFSNEVFTVLTTVYGTSIILGWDPNTEPDLAGYKIYHGVSSRSSGGYAIPDFHDIIPVGTETYTFANAANGIHYFSLTAFDDSGNESGFSNEVYTVVPDFELPYVEGVPTILNMTH